MCRGGRMFAPTKTYRRWHRKVNKNQRRYAIVSALAASASAPLVLARGHRIEKIPEVPLVIADDTIVSLEKTSAAVKLLTTLHAYEDVEKVKRSTKIRCGKGKMRNRRRVLRRGPLIIYDQKSSLCRAFRNLPGIDMCSVNRLNLLQLAPGGHLGRFIIWTKSAYQRLDSLYGTFSRPSHEKLNFILPRPKLLSSDIHRLITSDEIQSAIRLPRKTSKYTVHRKNPLRNLGFLIKLNPYAKTQRRRELLQSNVRVLKVERQRKIKKQNALKKAGKAKEEKKPKLDKRKHPRGRGRKNPKKKAFIKLLHQT
jgi:large subunit ribosomal protein L4e